MRGPARAGCFPLLFCPGSAASARWSPCPRAHVSPCSGSRVRPAPEPQEEETGRAWGGT